MATSAYFLVKATKAIREEGNMEALEDLRALPEVKYVEPVSGLYDCVAKVEAPTTLILVVNKMLAKSWVERVHVLKVDESPRRVSESEEERMARLMRQRELLKAHRKGPTSASPAGLHPQK